MDSKSPVLAIIPDSSNRDFYNQVASSLGYRFANILVGSLSEAASALSESLYSPKYIIIDIADNTENILPDLDALAEQCDMGAKVVVIGNTNDISFYRSLMVRGIAEYINHPASVESIREVFFKTKHEENSEQGSVISFIGAASGDGTSMIAMNIAFALSENNNSVILVDMDYQFGMIAKNLDLASQYGIKDVFDHPERGVDTTLISKMVVKYNDNLSVISAPNNLQYMPEVSPEQIREFIHSMRQKYKYVILDLPHIWNHWIASAMSSSDHIVIASQLWLKSVTHCSRMLAILRQIGVSDSNISLIVNRSGSKFKEAVNPKDFERVTNHKISFYIPNDIKTVVRAENNGSTIIELGNSSLSNQLKLFAADINDKLGNTKPKENNKLKMKRLT